MSDTHVTPPAAPPPSAVSFNRPHLSESQSLAAATSLLESARETAKLAGEDFNEAETVAQINAALGVEGIEADWAFDERTPEQRSHDAANAPASGPEAYRLDAGRPILANVNPADVQAVQAELGATAHAIGLPANVGSAFIDAALDSAERTAALRGPEARAQFKHEQVAALQRIAGSQEAYDALVAAAQSALAKAPPATVKALRDIGALDSAEVILTIAQHSQRLAVRVG